ncbi:MAG: HEAT repeat domain-containing protein [Mailhella sp.]|nr:HEAT repeat domain-containing protein [Mailhella sp.]
MPRFRSLKNLVRGWFRREDWSVDAPLPPECYEEGVPALSLVNALFACLTEGGDMADRAAYALGCVMPRVYEESHEDAKNIVRRFMWHMNEESGNIGWGIPEAFGETLAQCPPLADTFRRVLLHYIYDAPEGKSTSFCDHAPLRISCYKAIARLMEARPDFVNEFMPILRYSAMNETDEPCRAAAQALVRRYMLTAFA